MRLSVMEGVILKTRGEIDSLRAACSLASWVVAEASQVVRPGIAASAISNLARDLAAAEGAEIIAIFVSLNETAVHGSPSGRVVRHGDVVSLDVALRVDGWCGDCARSVVAGFPAPRSGALVWAAEAVARHCVAAVRPGGPISAVALAAVTEAAYRGFAVAEECLGHGLGHSLHEEPGISFSDPWHTGRFLPGMVVTIEPVVVEGSGELEDDGRGGMRTVDSGRAAHFEHAVAVSADTTEVLTDLDSESLEWISSPPNGTEWASRCAPP